MSYRGENKEKQEKQDLKGTKGLRMAFEIKSGSLPVAVRRHLANTSQRPCAAASLLHAATYGLRALLAVR